MTTSEALRLAHAPFLFLALGLLAYIGLRYSQGRELPRRTRLRVLGAAAGAVLVAAGLFVASLVV